MKNKILLSTFILLSIINYAKADPQLTAFNVIPNSSGYVTVSQTSSTTAIFNFTIQRPLASSGSSIGDYEPEDISIQLVYRVGNNEEALSQVYYYTGNNFAANNLYESYNFTIPANKVGGQIMLKWTYYTYLGNIPVTAYSGMAYTTTLTTPTPPPNVGIDSFVRNDVTGAIFVKMDGYFHWISTYSAFENCFQTTTITQNLTHMNTDPATLFTIMLLVPFNWNPAGFIGDTPDGITINGTTLTPTHFSPNDAFLATFSHDPSGAGKVYLVQRFATNVYTGRWIVNPAAASYYRFNLNKVRNITSNNIISTYGQTGGLGLAPTSSATTSNPQYCLFNNPLYNSTALPALSSSGCIDVPSTE